MPEQIEFVVHGLPKPQGSKRAIMGPHQKFPSVVESAGEKLKHWRHSVAQVAAETMVGKEQLAGAVSLRLSFFLPYSKGSYGTGKNAGKLKASAPTCHTKKPDLDKLVRAVCDSLSNRVYHDDSQIVRVDATKNYTTGSPRVIVAAWASECDAT